MISIVHVFCYREEGEALEEESAKFKNLCVVQSMQEEAKKIENVDSYMNACKCKEKNDVANCIPENVVETFLKIGLRCVLFVSMISYGICLICIAYSWP